MRPLSLPRAQELLSLPAPELFTATAHNIPTMLLDLLPVTPSTNVARSWALFFPYVHRTKVDDLGLAAWYRLLTSLSDVGPVEGFVEPKEVQDLLESPLAFALAFSAQGITNHKKRQFFEELLWGDFTITTLIGRLSGLVSSGAYGLLTPLQVASLWEDLLHLGHPGPLGGTLQEVVARLEQECPTRLAAMLLWAEGNTAEDFLRHYPQSTLVHHLTAQEAVHVLL